MTTSKDRMRMNRMPVSLTTISRSDTGERHTERITLHSFEIDYLVGLIDSRLMVLRQDDLVMLAKSVRSKLTANRPK